MTYLKDIKIIKFENELTHQLKIFSVIPVELKQTFAINTALHLHLIVGLYNMKYIELITFEVTFSMGSPAI